MERDLADILAINMPLTGENETLVLFPLGFDESSWYWNLPLEEALVSALGMNSYNFGLKPDVYKFRVAKCFEESAS